MKYWAWLVAKLAVAWGVLNVLWLGLERVMPEPTPFQNYRFARFGQDLPWTTAIMVLWLIGVGILYAVIWDQRYRCRTCLRRLCMPVLRGGWQHVLFGRPTTEYICPYGHGTLEVPELQITGREQDAWQPHQDIWKELESLGKSETRR